MAVSFAKQMQKATKNMKKSYFDVSVFSVTEFFRDVTFRSPIGDPSLWQNSPPADYEPGTFINSWNTAVGSGSPVVRKPDTFAKQTFAQIQSVVPKGIGGVLTFQNPTPYAFALEFGHSSQAPSGMVRIAVRNWPSIVKKAIRQKA